MFKEVLQIVPQLSGSDLNRMERSLQGRFTRIAKNFGKGLAGVLGAGGIVGAGAALIQKALSPLKEVQEAIERTLDKSSDIAVQAKQFGTTPGELAKLHAFGAAKGLDAGELDVLITKFQTAVAEAKADPTKASAVRGFTGNADTADAFFTFIQNLQKLGKTQQLNVQTEIFGEKQIGKMSEFLNADFPTLVKAFADIKTSKLTRDITKLDAVADFHKVLQSHTALADLSGKAAVINKGQSIAMNEAEKTRQAKENKQISDFQGLITIDQRMQAMQTQVEELTRDVLLKLPILTDGMSAGIKLLKTSVDGWKMIFDLLNKSPLVKGIIKYLPGGK